MTLFVAELCNDPSSATIPSSTLKPLSIGASALGAAIGIAVVFAVNSWVPLRTPTGLHTAFAATIVMLVLAANILAPTELGRRSNRATVQPTAPSDAGPSLEHACQQLAAAHGLTPRERDVLVYLAQGRDAKHIHHELRLSVNTVRTHMRHVYTKLDVHNQQELIDLARNARKPPNR